MYSIVLDLATPICVPDAVPLVDITSSYNWIVLYGVVSPEIEVTSGWPNTFVIFTKFPNSVFTEPAFIVSKSLALSMSLNVTPDFSISYPLTYALPGDIANASLSELAVLLSLVVSPVEYTPLKSTSLCLFVKPSLISNWKGLTV